jgi:hypothetical protein
LGAVGGGSEFECEAVPLGWRERVGFEGAKHRVGELYNACIADPCALEKGALEDKAACDGDGEGVCANCSWVGDQVVSKV